MAEGNSNQDALKVCKRCKNPAPNGITCIRCGTVSHKSCLKELQRKCKYITFIDSDKVNCCLEDISAMSQVVPTVTSAPETNNVSDTEVPIVSHLREIVKQKDFSIKQMELVIQNQSIAIEALKGQIALLTSMTNVDSMITPVEDRPTKKVPEKQPPLVSKSKDNSVRAKTTANKAGPSSLKNIITASQVSAAVHSANAHRVCETATSIENGSSNKHKKPAGRPGTKSRTILTGSLSNTEACPIKATVVSPMRHFHVTNLESNTDATCLKQYLCQFVPDVDVMKLSVRNPQKYSSFKVSVSAENAQLLLNSSIWPQGVTINRFFLSRRMQEPTASG